MAEIPSDGRSHRIRVAHGDGFSTQRCRTVPREAPEVYRELSLKNPFPWAILDGPADVYVDGGLVATTSLGRLDCGGESRVGLGVEERIKVVRNVRVEEEALGLLGGTTAVNHFVSIEVASSLGRKVLVEVLDRLPCTDDKDIEIKMQQARPSSKQYTQEENGSPVRGGMIWSLEIPPGGKETIEYKYRITLSSKSELVGGNRRD